MHITDVPATTPEVDASAYVQLNQRDGNAGYYDDVMYRPGGYDDHIWKLQRPVVARIASKLAAGTPLRALDFACGTGRILQLVEPYAAYSCGIDMSREMLDAAAQKCTRSDLLRADILAGGAVFDEPFDLITAFRFFLNTDDKLRLPVMRALAGLLRGPDARLVFNIHANPRSSIALTSAYRRFRGIEPVRAMSRSETETLIAAAGLDVVDCAGFGLFPRRLYRGRFAAPVKRIDSVSAARPIISSYSHDLLYVCRLRAAAV